MTALDRPARTLRHRAISALALLSLAACASSNSAGLDTSIPLPDERSQPAPVAPPVTLEEIFADQDWVARSPRGAYFSIDGQAVFFQRERAGSDVSDLVRCDLATGATRALADDERVPSNQDGWTFAPLRTPVRLERAARAPFVRAVTISHGDIFVWDGVRTEQLTRGAAASSLRFAAEPDVLHFMQDGAWWRMSLAGGSALLEVARLANGAEPERDAQRAKGFRAETQDRLIEVLRESERLADEERDVERQRRAADPTRAAEPFRAGAGRRFASQTLAPDARHVVAVTEADSPDDGERDQMPVWLTDSADVETRRVRAHVGEPSRLPQRLMWIDVEHHSQRELALDDLPGIAVDPLHDLRDTPLPDGPRGVRVRLGNWSPDGRLLAVQIFSTDDKDRWTVLVDKESGDWTLVEHLSDEAWIGGFNDLGWVPGSAWLWFMSERTGWSQLYLFDTDGGATRALTHGEWEVDDVAAAADGSRLYFRGNATDLGVHEVWSVGFDGAEPQRETFFEGRVGSFELTSDGGALLCSVSRALEPTELYHLPLAPGANARRLTNTIEPHWTSRPWVEPEYVVVPGRSGRGVPARLYRPAGPASGLRPAVLFVHGAGYLQNAHHGFSTYSREFMFHTFLVEHGFVVLDMDYRASAGNGRDWRTAIHRHMGGPELEDLVDGARWLVDELDVDAARIGLYGGSYGGFLTLMALFKEPDVFACGAALRPVTDWSHYNDGYTSNILHTPELDPEAYRRSSPIEFAEGLADPLLVCHGLVDDNVLAKDSIRLSQRLIELGKQDFEIMLYPAEAHAFRWPASWLDEYRRIWKLFETNLVAP